jgi:MSHA biogenesis protein MshJ
MNSKLEQYRQRFDAQSLRERGLIAFSLIVVIGFGWWNSHAEPMMKKTELLQTENQRLGDEVEKTRAIAGDIRQRIAGGVYREKEFQLAMLGKELDELEDQLRVKTVELIDPGKMFELMNQLIYRDSRLQLLSLKRREVKPAIPSLGEEETEEPALYRHVLEIKLAGKYLDILKYMQTLESLDWKLLWDEIEIQSDEHPKVTVEVAISTLSTRKEWVGI